MTDNHIIGNSSQNQRLNIKINDGSNQEYAAN